ncbi:hypothetical protein Pint_17924 [Pistacia integerrima]|uniref:Uncharacterized protein n=1 Tax=Pistacia integerrima TaxID=434235 RepID=A0ACC0YU88_9ROSI|nr:hypothetical protein Pint_17924 [Pistacia integerrima]
MLYSEGSKIQNSSDASVPGSSNEEKGNFFKVVIRNKKIFHSFFCSSRFRVILLIHFPKCLGCLIEFLFINF